MNPSPTDPQTHPSVDVAIVGAGPTGLAAAVALARSLRSVLVVDTGQPRNAPSAHAHNVLGNEGTSPRELLASGRREAENYGSMFTDTAAVSAEIGEHGLTLQLADGSRVETRAVLLASGIRDELPDIPGIEAAWGSGVIQCPYCHGYEARGKRIGVLATSPMSAHQALLMRQLSDDVTVILHAGRDIIYGETGLLEARGIRLVEAQVTGLRTLDSPVETVGSGPEAASTSGAETSGRPVLTGVSLSDGSTLDLDTLVVMPRAEPRAELFEMLGGQLEEFPGGRFVPVDEMNATSVTGVWAAGSITNPKSMVMQSASAGLSAAIAINNSMAVAEAHAALEGQQPT